MGKEAKRAARERLAQERRRQAQRAKRNRSLAIVGGAIVVIIVVVAAGLGWQHVHTSSADTKFSGPLAPVSKQSDGTVVMGKKSVKKPVLDLYEDFQCPNCREFEKTSGDTVKKLAAQGKAKVVYHPVAFVNPVGSRRAAAAAQCVPSSKWMAFHDKLYASQPDETKTETYSQLERWAKDVGVSGKAFTACVNSKKYEKPVAQRTTKAFSRHGTQHITGTPSGFLDGKQLDLGSVLMSPKSLRSTVEKAK